jgi:hypothetical protein
MPRCFGRPLAPIAEWDRSRNGLSALPAGVSRTTDSEEAEARGEVAELGVAGAAAGLGDAGEHAAGDVETARPELGAREARGEIIVQWDDDDWYAPDRISIQVRPIAAGRADLTGLVLRYVLELETRAFWQPRAALLGRLFALDLAAATLALRRGLLDRASFPSVNVGEDVGLLRGALRARQRLHRVAAGDVDVYVRHGRNTWQFPPAQAPGWSPIDPAATSLPPDLLGM